MHLPWKFPDKAKFGRTVPKNKIYEHSVASAGLKSLFVEQVEQILWAYKLSPSTLNIPQTNGVSEIQVFTLKLKGDSLNESVLKAIDTAIPFPILFEVWSATSSKGHYAACYKRLAENDHSKWVCSRYLYSERFPIVQETEKRQAAEQDTKGNPLPIAINMAELYQKILDQLLPIPKRKSESIEDAIVRLTSIQALKKRIARNEKKIHLERQFNRKVELNKERKNLKNELEQLIS